ncbi:MAG: glycosyltransferase family 4 protein [Beduini sp.]|uniref:glycosyltransferase family 4 protein n=1 Tax=Beduini sp. TaxID=1922300 RepID=UPI0039A37684
MKKALMYASVASMIQQFNMENINLLQKLGYTVEVACNFEFGSTISKEKIENLKLSLKNMNIIYHHIPIPRKISDISNLRESYKLTKQLMNQERYDLIHCHSPIGGIICRLANKHSNNYDNSRMIYTAHGFHFFKGNNAFKNFLFRSIEMYGARYTDVLITINKEDYEAASKFKLRRNGTVKYIPGIGIDLDKINSIQGNKEDLINELDIPKDSILLLSVGELNDNKNHGIVIEALSRLPNNIHYLICGIGPLKDTYMDLAKQLGLEKRLHLLGYKNNIIEIMKSSDIFVFPSKREGLSVALMEAMACGLPCVATRIRGNIDLIQSEMGFLFSNNMECCKTAISKYIDLENNEKIKMSKNCEKQIQKYSLEKIQDAMKNIYSK